MPVGEREAAAGYRLGVPLDATAGMARRKCGPDIVVRIPGLDEG